MATSPAAEFTNELRFRHTWRPYQARVLGELPKHVRDRHFHVVAPPGAGKTTLGLEAIRRLGRRCLVLAPTIAVREQWAHRLRSDFLEPGAAEPEWLGRDLATPRPLTLATYQSLAASFKADGGDAVLAALTAMRIDAIVVDEAHHLRAFWWSCLDQLKSSIDRPMIVALTATPPYDVPQAEWSRYARFCGVIDEEVGVPELVRSGSLCPHQDYVYFSVPAAADLADVDDFGRRVTSCLVDFQSDTELAGRIAEHPLFAGREAGEAADEAAIVDRQEFFLAAAIYFAQVAGRVPTRLRVALALDGVELPPLDLTWSERLLQGLLFDDRETLAAAPELAEPLGRLRRQLTDVGAVEAGSLALDGTKGTGRLLATSPTKIAAVCEILELEGRELGERLRGVVLTDYIRRDAFPSADGADDPYPKLGVVPIFEALRRLRLPDVRPGILTGSLTVLPAGAAVGFRDRAAAAGLDPDRVQFRELDHDPGFVRADLADAERAAGVRLVTELFAAGDLNCLVGTAALLGEGWDAPRVNCLVLASAIGSYVTSNQMRGRAIRVDPLDPDKTANIWHLACLLPDPLATQRRDADGAERPEPGDDFRTLTRRFRGFAGIPLTPVVRSRAATSREELREAIEDGIERLGLDTPTAAEVRALNARMCRAATSRAELDRRWRRAVADREARDMRPWHEVDVHPRWVETRFQARLRRLRPVTFRETELPFWQRWLDAFRRRRLRRRLLGIGRAVLVGLRDAGLLDTELSVGAVTATVDARGRGDRSSIGLSGAGTADQARFASALAELFDLRRSPRYLIATRGSFFAVPDELGQNKDRAALLGAAWRRHVGKHELLYTRSHEGKRELAAARRLALLAGLEGSSVERVRWR